MGHASATQRQRLESARNQAVLTERAAGEYLSVAPAVLGYLVRKVYEKSIWAMRLHLLTFQAENDEERAELAAQAEDRLSQ